MHWLYPWDGTQTASLMASYYMQHWGLSLNVSRTSEHQRAVSTPLRAGCFTQTPPNTPYRALDQRATSSVHVRPTEQHAFPLFHDWLTRLNNSRVRPCCPRTGLYKAGEVVQAEARESAILIEVYSVHTVHIRLHVFISPLTSVFWMSMKLILWRADPLFH